MRNPRPGKGIKLTLHTDKVFFATEKWNTYTTGISTSSHLLSHLLHLSRQLLRGTDWIFFWMLNLLVKPLMGWSQWQNSYSGLTGPEIWFLTCIISSLNFVSSKVIPKYKLLFKSSWHPPTPAAKELSTCNHIQCSNLPAIRNPTINSYHGSGSIFDKATLLMCIIGSGFLIFWNTCLDCKR